MTTNPVESALPTGVRVVVGMSGGVDSSLAAWLLKQAGNEVVGAFIRCWEEDGKCTAGEDAVAAAAAADRIGIELEVIDLTAEYRDQVFAGFLDELRCGRTPNPDVWCNAQIKFRAFADYALQILRGDYLATGHYARIDYQRKMLLKAEDENKDQSYFLYRVPATLLKQLVFPLGGMLKSAVRSQARKAGLPNADRPESMGICFVGKRSFREFVTAYLPPRRGLFVSADGKALGEHAGSHLFTIGQRHGLGLGGAGEPWFVAAKDSKANTVTVVRGRQHPLLQSAGMTLDDCHWFEADGPRRNWVYTCRHRHRMPPAPCTLTVVASGGQVTAGFAEPQWGVAPGQAGVLYDGIYCLGGGTIKTATAVVQ